MKSTPSSDPKHFSGLEQDLFKIHMTTMKQRLRIRLLQALLDQGLSTRDIFYFARGQADLRSFKKTPDWATIRSAMMAKMSDVKSALNESYTSRSRLRLQLLEEYGDRKYKLRKFVKRINASVQSEKKNMWEKI